MLYVANKAWGHSGLSSRKHEGSELGEVGIMDEFLCIGQQVSVRREINFSKFEKFYACEIGYETKIGAFICEGVLVGARSVVTKDVPPFRVVRGNPAGIVKQLVHSQEGDGQ